MHLLTYLEVVPQPQRNWTTKITRPITQLLSDS